MTIQRQYRLPNCTVTVEGLSQTTTGGDSNIRPSLDLVMRFECLLAGQPPLVGDNNLLEQLVETVKQSVQAYLSGVNPRPAGKHHDHQVELKTTDVEQFQLRVPGELLLPEVTQPDVSEAETTATRQTVELMVSTVQLFDLSEALDQLLLDQQTLPNLSFQVTPLSRRHAAAAVTGTPRAVPAALGTSSLVLAAIALYFLPVPTKVAPPKNPPATQEQTTPQPRNSTTPAAPRPTGTPR